MLHRFLGFWSGSEPALDGWARRQPELAARLDWSRRRRTPRLHRDLDVLAARLGRPRRSAPIAPPVFRDAGTADVLGWLYVAEGSTLGGAVISRQLQRGAGAGLRLETFTPYDEGPVPMWLAFRAELEAWTGSDQLRCERVAAAGVRTFAALHGWLEPVCKDAAA